VSIFADVFQVDFDPDTNDISREEVHAWDSINHFRLISELEETFGVSLSDDEVSRLASLRDVKAMLARRGHTAVPTRS
jgi:acyl carrier protein